MITASEIQTGLSDIKAEKTNAFNGRATKLKLVTKTTPVGIATP